MSLRSVREGVAFRGTDEPSLPTVSFALSAHTWCRDARGAESPAYHPAMAGKRALITGIGGQDGSYLAELLLDEGYEVFGVVRQLGTSQPNLAAVSDRIELLEADLLDFGALVAALRTCEANE